MSFPQALERQQTAIFERLGVFAQWQGIDDPVLVRRREADEQLRFDRSTVIEEGATIKVRQVEVAQPAIGDQVQILDDDGNAVTGALFAVTGEPMLDRRGVWTCPVRLSA